MWIRRNRTVSLLMAGLMVLSLLWVGPARSVDAAEEGVGVLTIAGETVTLDGSDVTDDSGATCKAADLVQIIVTNDGESGSCVITGAVGNASLQIDVKEESENVVESGGRLTYSKN